MQTPSRFPLRMRQKSRWLGWKWGIKGNDGRRRYFEQDTLEPHDGHLWHRRADGTLERASKLPVMSSAPWRASSVSDASTWSTFEAALDAHRRGDVDGVGYVLDAGETLIDVDGCMVDGELNAFARALISKMDSYTELSVSGEGVHILCVAEGFTPDRGQKGARIECYVGGFTNRFCTVSGNVLDGYDDLDDDAEDVLSDVYQTEFAQRPVISEEARAASERFLREARLIELSQDDERAVAWMCGHFKHARAMFGAANYLGWAQDREKFNAIANGDSSELASGADDGRRARDASRSAADFALASYLLAATEGDGDRALALLLKSGMARPKYFEVHDGRNPYALMTVASVLKHVDVGLMRQRAFERRDKQLDNLLEQRPDMRPLDDLMRRDDVTPAMLMHVMAYHATGAVRQDPHTWLCNYPRAFVPWAIERWPSIVTLAYRYDLGLGEVIHE